MAIYGRRTARSRRLADTLRLFASILKSRACTAAVLAAIPLLLNACSTSFHGGSPPPIDRLAGLTVGVSTVSDVNAALGKPSGHGAVGLSDAPTQDIWVYESHEVEGSASHQNLLFVFVDRQSGVFNGYMWFRGGALIAQTR